MRLAICVILFLYAGCSESPDPQFIVDKAIEAHGGKVLEHSEVEFDFRGRHYVARHDGGMFVYMRSFKDSTGFVTDVLGNSTLFREINGKRAPVPKERLSAYGRSVNAVIYYALLPYKLNDPAVRKHYLGTTGIGGEPYHKIGITFEEEGGGRDYNDRYVFWIHERNYTMDYFAYTFDDDGGGTRFRKAINARTIEGVRIADYQNFTSEGIRDIEDYGKLLGTDDLRLVSEIVLENVKIRPLLRFGGPAGN